MGFYSCVIVNPASRNGATGRSWPELRKALDRVLDRWDNQFTTGPGDATRLARQAVMDGYEMIVSVGGDGTMNEVVTGLLADPASEGKLLKDDLVLASVRQGTGGDFARYLGQSGDLPAAVTHLAGDRTRPADLGVITFAAHDGQEKTRAFLNIASFGLSGLVDEKVNTSSKALGGKVSFLIGLGRALATYKTPRVRLLLDGAPFLEDTIVTCAVANGQYFGGGMRFAPDAVLDDGLFDVVAQTSTGIYEVTHVADLYSGKHLRWPSVRSSRAKVVRAEPVDAHARVLLDVDGEGPGCLPATFRVLPSCVRIKVA